MDGVHHIASVAHVTVEKNLVAALVDGEDRRKRLLCAPLDIGAHAVVADRAGTQGTGAA
ncbi:hypothetical protein D3C72_2501890 [compost metagenome]